MSGIRTVVRAGLRHRPGRYAVPALAMTLGGVLVMTFGSLLDVYAADPAMDDDSAGTLITMAAVVGGWALVIVTFAVASTLGLSVTQRGAELASLRALGATPGALRRMIVLEAMVLALLGTLVAVAPAYLAGRAVLGLLRDSGQVAGSVAYGFGPIAVGIGLLVLLGSAVAGGLLAGNRVVSVAAGQAARDVVGGGRIGPVRRVAAAACALGATALAVATVVAMKGTGIDAMKTAGQASVLMSVAGALAAPLLLRRLLGRGSDAGAVAGQVIRARVGPLASAIAPVVLFVGISVGTLYMFATEEAAPAAAGSTMTATEVANVQTLNVVVVGAIALFLAIMAVNTLASATGARGREFAQLRVAGATRARVLRAVLAEGAVVVALGVLLGTVAAGFTALPFSYARTGSWLPEGSPLAYVGVVAAAAAVVWGTSGWTAWQRLRTPPLAALALAD